MAKFAVYSKDGSFPEAVFDTRRQATEFIGNATALYELRVFKHLNAKQIVMLSLSNALAFEDIMNYAVTNTQTEGEKR